MECFTLGVAEHADHFAECLDEGGQGVGAGGFAQVVPWSGKARDLRRDPRCVLHTTINRPDAGEPELKLYGLTAAAGDQLRNACRQAWWTGQPRAAADVFLLGAC